MDDTQSGFGFFHVLLVILWRRRILWWLRLSTQVVVYKKVFGYSESFKFITGGDVVVVNRGGGSVDLKGG